jgi:hypothetical protein
MRRVSCFRDAGAGKLRLPCYNFRYIEAEQHFASAAKPFCLSLARVAKLADARDLKNCAGVSQSAL